MGCPRPVFNYIRRIVLYLVASTATDNLKMNAAPLACAGQGGAERLCRVVNAQFEELFERNKMGMLIRQFMRNAAVDGDACLYAWFDPGVETGQAAGARCAPSCWRTPGSSSATPTVARCRSSPG